ncbi:NAD(P)/FAD-dependent oxidoreductase [Novosphingopyxis sp.]|uniref:NAD(P)/FAD-dependent oxidoreductase n=1 Tax=Novosphingopyxis sp. TaxID=2709690 RepID=UPI003B5974D3
MSRYDVAIVGAGIAGASLAAALAPHRSVLLLEAEDRPGYHSTGRSAAFWTESYGGPGIQPLTSASFEALSEGGFLKPRGALHLAEAADGGSVDRFVGQFAGSGVRLTRLDRADLERRVPGIRPGWSEGVWEPDCHDIDVAALHASYLRQARAAAAALQCRAALLEAKWSRGRWWIETPAGSFEAALLINAAGAWADEVALRSSVRPCEIRPYRRSIAQLRIIPDAPADLPLVLGLDGSFYFKPEPGGRLWLSPHDETLAPPGDAAPEEMDIARAIQRLGTVVDWRVAAVEHRWAGLRSFAPDRLPVIGFAPDAPAFFWFAGQGGFGIQTAPAAAALAAGLILPGPDAELPPGVDPRLYAPNRFHRHGGAQNER